MDDSTVIKLPNGKICSLAGIRRLLDALFPESAENRVDDSALWWKKTKTATRKTAAAKINR